MLRSSAEYKFWSRRLRGRRLTLRSSITRQYQAARVALSREMSDAPEPMIPGFLRRDRPTEGSYAQNEVRLDSGVSSSTGAAELMPRPGSSENATSVFGEGTDVRRSSGSSPDPAGGEAVRDSIPCSNVSASQSQPGQGDLIAPRRASPTRPQEPGWLERSVDAAQRLRDMNLFPQDMSRAGHLQTSETLIVVLAFLLFFFGSIVGGVAFVILLLARMRR